jgi:hypothetical protein
MKLSGQVEHLLDSRSITCSLGAIVEVFGALRAAIKDEFHRNLFDASVQSLGDTSNKLRLTNFLTGMRELVREILHFYATDDEVRACGWFVPDKTSRNGTTRQHRMSYIVHGGIAPELASSRLNISVSGECKALVMALDICSKYTHVTKETFAATSQDVETYALQTSNALLDFILAVEAAHSNLTDAVVSKIEHHVLEEIIAETISDVDELATHHSIDEVTVDAVEIEELNSEEIRFVATGYLGVILQYGSDSDVRNDIGPVTWDSYPLTMNFTSSVDNPTLVAPVAGSLKVDTSAFYE